MIPNEDDKFMEPGQGPDGKIDKKGASEKAVEANAATALTVAPLGTAVSFQSSSGTPYVAIVIKNYDPAIYGDDYQYHSDLLLLASLDDSRNVVSKLTNVAQSTDYTSNTYTTTFA